jgi:hypothetical protein
MTVCCPVWTGTSSNPSRTTVIQKDISNLTAAVMAEWELHFPLSHDSCRQPQTYVKPEAAITVFELLMMNGVSLETC